MPQFRERHQTHILMVEQVAEALKHLRERVVFIGGSIIGLLITDGAAPDVRSTKDVDVIIEVASIGDHADTEGELRKLGFKHDISGEGHILRFLLGELIVDILPTDSSRFGMRTHWYKSAVRSAMPHTLANGTQIKLVSAPLLLCTKFDAYDDRGKGNLRESKDIGDILAVLDGRPELLDEIKNSEEEAQDFICKKFDELRRNPDLPEAFTWQFDQDQQQRESLILERIEAISKIRAPD